MTHLESNCRMNKGGEGKGNRGEGKVKNLGREGANKGD